MSTFCKFTYIGGVLTEIKPIAYLADNFESVFLNMTFRGLIKLLHQALQLSSLKYVDICLPGDDSRDVKCVSVLCDSGAEICVANSSVVEGLNLAVLGKVIALST